MTDATNTNAAESTKAPVEIKTRKHAAFLLSAAVARLAKEQAAVAETEAAIVKYQALVETLPESVEAVTVVIEPGKTVAFEYGRGETRRELFGVVKGRKDSAEGKPEQYRICIGEGFDEQSYVVQPGSIKRVVEADDAAAE